MDAGRLPLAPSVTEVKPTNTDIPVPKRVLEVLDILKCNHFWQKRSEKVELKKSFANLADVDLNNLLNDVIKELAKDNHGEDPIKTMERLSQYIPYEKLEAATKMNKGEALLELNRCKELYSEAKNYVSSASGISVTIKARVNAVIDSLIAILETILSAFGIADILKPTETDEDAGAKSSKVIMLISTFALLAATMLPIFGIVTGATIIGATMLGIALLSVVWPHIKPVTSYIDRADNWTQQTQLGEMPTAYAKKSTVDELATKLSKNKPVLIHGTTGIEERNTVKAFTQAVERGDYPEYQGKKVFYFETARLVNRSNAKDHSKVVGRILESLGRHSDRIILVFDGFDIGFDRRFKAIGRELLSTFEKFPYVVCMATTDAAQKIGSEIDPYFNQNRIQIKSTEKDETLNILQSYVAEKYPEALFDKGMLAYIYDATQNEPQPVTALSVLEECISRSKGTQKSNKKVDLDKANDQLFTMYRQRAEQSPETVVEFNKKIAELEKQVDDLEKALKDQNKNVEFVNNGKETIADVKLRAYKTVLKIGSFKADKLEKRDQAAHSRFLLLSRFNRELESTVRARSVEVENAIGFRAVITKNMIDKVIIDRGAADAERNPKVVPLAQPPANQIEVEDVILEIGNVEPKPHAAPVLPNAKVEPLPVATAVNSSGT